MTKFEESPNASKDIKVIIDGKEIPFDDVNGPDTFKQRLTSDGLLCGSQFDMTVVRTVEDGDKAFLDWILSFHNPKEPYRFPFMVLGVGDTGLVIEFKDVYVCSHDRGKFTIDHKGWSLWFENPRSGAYIWDNEIALWAWQRGVYDFLIRGGVIDSSEGRC